MTQNSNYADTVNQLFDSIVSPETFALPVGLIPHEAEDLEERMTIYQKGYKIRLVNAVSADYPVLQHFVGDILFQEWVKEYVDATPSSSFNLDRYTHRFPAFLAKNVKISAAVELATLEGKIDFVFMAEESAPLQWEAFSGLTPEQFAEFCFIPRPALALLQFEHSVNAYLTDVRNQDLPKELVAQPEYLALCRTHYEVKRHVLDHNAYLVLQALCEGKSVGEAFEVTFGNMQEPLPTPETIQAWFRDWVMFGFFKQP